MPRKAKAPPGFYSATEAIKMLGVPHSTFYTMIEKGTIKQVIPPGRKTGYYLKPAIDNLVKARQLFTIEYATDSPIFQQATEADIQGIYDVCLSLWGTRGTYPYELRLARYMKNPQIFYVLKYLDIVVGYATIMPITQRAVDEIIQGKKRAWEAIALDDILPFEPGTLIDYAFVEIGVRDAVPKPKQFGMRLIVGIMNTLEEFARSGIFVKKLFAVSSTPDGIRICRDFGFKETSLTPEGTRFS